jgi:hypothetical protein
LLCVFAIAPTQSGKTGTMLSLIYRMGQSPLISLPTTHVFIFTPISSTDWVTQTTQRMPAGVRVFHRNHIREFILAVRESTNILIIIDETHVAAKPNQAMHNIYEEIGAYDRNHLMARNIKLVHFTATPCNLEAHFSTFWGTQGAIYRMRVPQQYISFETLLRQHRVFHAKNFLTQPDAVRELRPFLRAPRAYHIIRTPVGIKHRQVIDIFKHALSDFDADFISEPESKKSIDAILTAPPPRHTFVFIKEKLRCAKTIPHRYVGILYERAVDKPMQHVNTQGLPGRITGYHKNTHAVVFSNHATQRPIKHNFSFWALP